MLQVHDDEELRIAHINDWQVNGAYVTTCDTGDLVDDDEYVSGALILSASELIGIDTVDEMCGTMLITDMELNPTEGFFLHYSPTVLANASINQ